MEERTCRACGSRDLVTITMSLGAQAVSFTACHNCESKWWYRDGERIELSSVLDLVAPTPG
jgi:formate dehydrogenase maturation protein FdhE